MEIVLGINEKRDIADLLFQFDEKIEGKLFNYSIEDALKLIETIASKPENEDKIKDTLNNIFGYYSSPLKLVDGKIIAKLFLGDFEKSEFFEFFNLMKKVDSGDVVRYCPKDKDFIELEIQLERKFIQRAILRVDKKWLESNKVFAKDLVRSFVNLFRWQGDGEKFFDFSSVELKEGNGLIENYVLDGKPVFQVRINFC
jgi:hypothetical protein